MAGCPSRRASPRTDYRFGYTKAPANAGANVSIIWGHFQKCLTTKHPHQVRWYWLYPFGRTDETRIRQRKTAWLTPRRPLKTMQFSAFFKITFLRPPPICWGFRVSKAVVRSWGCPSRRAPRHSVIPRLSFIPGLCPDLSSPEGRRRAQLPLLC